MSGPASILREDPAAEEDRKRQREVSEKEDGGENGSGGDVANYHRKRMQRSSRGSPQLAANRFRTSRPPQDPNVNNNADGNGNKYIHILKICSGSSSSSFYCSGKGQVMYKIGESMQDLIKLWRDYDDSSSQSGPPSLEIRIPADLVTATNRQVSVQYQNARYYILSI